MNFRALLPVALPRLQSPCRRPRRGPRREAGRPVPHRQPRGVQPARLHSRIRPRPGRHRPGSGRGHARTRPADRDSARRGRRRDQCVAGGLPGILGTAAHRPRAVRSASRDHDAGVVPLHLVARARSGIKSVVDLRGRPVSLGIPDGEAYRAAVAVLEAFGVDPASVSNRSLPAETAAVELQAGRIQAMFVVSNYPAEAVREAIGAQSYLVSIDGPPADRLRARSGFLYPRPFRPAPTPDRPPRSVRWAFRTSS